MWRPAEPERVPPVTVLMITRVKSPSDDGPVCTFSAVLPGRASEDGKPMAVASDGRPARVKGIVEGAPAEPGKRLTVTMYEPDPPLRTVWSVGAGEMVKSKTFKFAVSMLEKWTLSPL